MTYLIKEKTEDYTYVVGSATNLDTAIQRLKDFADSFRKEMTDYVDTANDENVKECTFTEKQKLVGENAEVRFSFKHKDMDDFVFWVEKA